MRGEGIGPVSRVIYPATSVASVTIVQRSSSERAAGMLGFRLHHLNFCLIQLGRRKFHSPEEHRLVDVDRLGDLVIDAVEY